MAAESADRNCTKFAAGPPEHAPPGGRSSRCGKAPSAGTRHPPSGHFARPGKRSPGQGSGAAGRCLTRRPAGLRRGITCQPTQLEGPSQLLLQPAAPWARGASTSRCCRRRPNPYLRSAPNKNLRGRRQAAGRDVTGGSADDRSVLGWAYRAVRSIPATHSVSQRPRKPVALSGSTRAAPLAPLSALPISKGGGA